MDKPRSVVCAVRGGPASKLSTRQAAAKARLMGARLIFLYVVNQSDDEEMDDGLQFALQTEGEWLARAMLNLWKGRVENAGIQVQIIIRKGQLIPEIIACLQEESAEIFFIGAPRGTTAHIMGDDEIERVAQTIQDQTNVPVEIVRPEIAD
jgi:nucleotide-binding universal stress UspA family protein